MKIKTVILMSLILLGACGHQSKNYKLDMTIVQLIKDYYQINYGEGTRLEEFVDATAIKLTYYDTLDKDEENDNRIIIIGNSSCYSGDDAICCPSLHYKTKVAFDNNELKYVSKKRIQ